MMLDQQLQIIDKMSYITVKRNGMEFSFHKALSQNMDKLVKHQKDDWDFKVAISGDGATRTGKSTLGAQTCAYNDPTFIDNWKERIIFDGQKLIETAYKVPKGSWLMYDEAKEGLDSKKQMEKYVQNLLEFFSQCGNLNLGIVIILPEFFELPKSVAINQTICLMNCYARNGFQRGYFDFFSRNKKKYLYIKGQKFLDYGIQTPSFRGTFVNWFPVDKEEYEDLKSKTLIKLRNKHNFSKVKEESDTNKVRLRILLKFLMKNQKVKPAYIAELLAVHRTTIYKMLKVKKDKK